MRSAISKDLSLRSSDGPRKIVAVIGDIMVDRYLTGRIERISPEAPVPVLVHNHERTVAGGAANVAMNIASLGCAVHLVGAIGSDADGEDIRTLLSDAGISPEWLVVDPGRPTISKTRIVSGRQQLVRIDRELTGRLASEVEERIIRAAGAAISKADIVVLSDYAKGVFGDRVLLEVIGAAKSAGKPVLVDPKRRTFEVYRGADVIKPNAGELSAATGLPCATDQDLEAAALELTKQFAGTLVVTRGEAGLSLFSPGQPARHITTVAQEVADVSGAGDTALAALAVAMAEGLPIDDAAVISNFAAGIAVGKLGTAVISRKELNTALLRASEADYHPGALTNLAAAAEMANAWRLAGERVVFANGCFDLVHAGHIELLTSAAAEGDRLIVGLNSDASVRRLKGPTRPIQTEADRARIVGALRAVDLVVLFDEDTPLALIDAICPDVLVKGADYTEDKVVGGDLVKSRGGRVALVPLVVGRSSTTIVERMRS